MVDVRGGGVSKVKVEQKTSTKGLRKLVELAIDKPLPYLGADRHLNLNKYNLHLRDDLSAYEVTSKLNPTFVVVIPFAMAVAKYDLV